MTRTVAGGLGFLTGFALAIAMGATPPRLIVDPTIQDVAVTYPRQYEIHVNPLALAMLPPDLASFLLLHEQGHLVLRHDGKAIGVQRRDQELAADCWAARRATNRERAIAIRFLQALGPVASATHPAGLARAAEVVRCSP